MLAATCTQQVGGLRPSLRPTERPRASPTRAAGIVPDDPHSKHRVCTRNSRSSIGERRLWDIRTDKGCSFSDLVELQQKAAVTAAVDLAAKSTPRTMKLAPAVMGDGSQRPAVLGLGWWQVAAAAEMTGLEAASAMAEILQCRVIAHDMNAAGWRHQLPRWRHGERRWQLELGLGKMRRARIV
jgi:hypothetical protein